MKRRTHNNRDTTRNERAFVVRYERPQPATPDRKTWDFNTRDRRQAFRVAAQYAEVGTLVGLFRHSGRGLLERLEMPGEKSSRKAIATPHRRCPNCHRTYEDCTCTGGAS